jgi:hypothetical protein
VFRTFVAAVVCPECAVEGVRKGLSWAFRALAGDLVIFGEASAVLNIAS